MKKLGILFVLISLSCSVASAEYSNPNLEITPSVLSQKVPRNGVRIPFLILRLKAKTDTWVSEIDVRQTGLSVATDVKKVYAQISNVLSFGVSVANNGLAQIKFKSPVLLPAGKIVEARVLVNLNAAEGHTIGFALENIVTSDKGVAPRKNTSIIQKKVPTASQQRSELLRKSLVPEKK